ncbi:glutaredoxin family protein [Sporosarcina sp. ACRSL]|uniref:glutaredoxin family protein n=1 Tax=Sporosarcina sp. ACRSL TaxID=2918215 RepID=UPI001EF64818|nr:glutaredoxin family protein [Sporosarcina sp. ACRSL]MCG7344967.1 glutaredoxin family protein [Sporosarcina sp. ACRSL]
MTKTLNIIVWSKKGCHYCEEVKQYLEGKGFDYKSVDVTEHDDRRDILEIKYGVRHVPVIELGQGNVYKGVTEVGLEFLEKALEEVAVKVK